MTILVVGIDLAKNVFAVHGVDEAGKPALLKPTVARSKLHELIASLPPCVVAMEACSGAHDWARKFIALGHTVRLMAAKFVAPYRLSGKKGKNDAADAAAICEAAQRPNMRFVPIKSLEQQSVLCVHRVRQSHVEHRTATVNRTRGLMAEFGIVMPQGTNAVRRQAAQHLEDLPGMSNLAIGDLLSELHRLDEQLAQYDRHLHELSKHDPRVQQLMQLCGVGPTCASCIVAMVGSGQEFKSARQFAAWLGLTPSQHSSGGKARLGRITKSGDGYLRTLLVLGARSALLAAKRYNKTDPVSRWVLELEQRRGYGKAVVALAAKNARMAWAILRKGEAFKLPS